jgi:transmembrane sensor
VSQLGASPAADIENSAAQWLERRDHESWSASDETEFGAWLNESPAHAVAYWRLEGIWNTADRLAVLRVPELENVTPMPRRRWWPLAIGMAAGFVAIAALGVAAAHYILQPHERSYATDVGGRESVTFADGSVIELNTNTVLRARMTSSERTIWLDRGEAYFQVHHDAAHPFVVFANGHRITDLGTKFRIRRDAAHLEVALLEGRVRFDAAAGKSSLLMPGDVATANGAAISIAREPAEELAEELSWRRGVLVFKHRTLADVAAEFNRYNQKKIVLADASVGGLKIYGTFRTVDVDLFARVTQHALGMNVDNEGNEIVISR